jgi:hypothetical protein
MGSRLAAATSEMTIRSLVVMLMLVGAARAEVPMAPDVKARFDAALKQYSTRHYEDAISELRAIYEIDPRPNILFTWAQAERLSGDCPSAVVLYKKFIATGPTGTSLEAAQLNLKKCEDALSTMPEEAKPKPVPTPEPIIIVREREAPPPTWQKDKLGIGLTVAGGVLLVAGAGVAGGSAAVESSATSATSYNDYSNRIDTARTLRTTGFVVLGVGAVAAIIGVVRFAIVARRAPPKNAALGLGSASVYF